MQIDPAALSRADAASASIASSKGAAANALASQKSTKALISVPRLELEPAYTELKAAIGDHWAEYKTATALFLLGMRFLFVWCYIRLGVGSRLMGHYRASQPE